ncbi:hypothetical protein LCGC14_0022630 [marine sediment metagenome]|uniref:Uncharacterized protein n=1 Tax=marine sediment metagenome TaxID=412755 RepID=A0A0F9W387_9ZZZZ
MMPAPSANQGRRGNIASSLLPGRVITVVKTTNYYDKSQFRKHSGRKKVGFGVGKKDGWQGFGLNMCFFSHPATRAHAGGDTGQEIQIVTTASNACQNQLSCMVRHVSSRLANSVNHCSVFGNSQAKNQRPAWFLPA